MTSLHASRPAELAGTWYPATAQACEEFFATVQPSADHAIMPHARGCLVPHAGWIYSGGIAYRALARLAQAQPNADLLIVLGGHLGERDPTRVFIRGAWDTPLGPFQIDAALAEDISMSLNADVEDPDEYYEDNAIEVLLPMLKHLWPQSKGLAIGIPPVAEATQFGVELIERAQARGYKKIVVIGSSDLTHYGPNYSFQPAGRGQQSLDWVKSKNDPELIEHMLQMHAQKIVWTATRSRNACCPGNIAATLMACRKLGAKNAKLIDYSTSWDQKPNGTVPQSFVGYAGLLFG